MKQAFNRRYRRRSPSKSEGGFFKKENQQEQAFFGETASESFFRPVSALPQTVQRSAEPEKEEQTVQRAAGEKEEEVQRQAAREEEDPVMKKEDKKEKEEEKVQKKEMSSSGTGSTTVSKYIGSLGSKGQPLPAAANFFFSSRMGYDFSQVKLHTDQEAATSAGMIHAKAYTTGNHIVFNEGQYNMGSAEGKRLMAHELAHVVQQGRGEKKLMRELKSKTEKTYSITISKGDKNWEDKEIGYLVNALKKLNDKELKAVAGYDFVRWSDKATRAGMDKTYIPSSSPIENSLHEFGQEKGIYRITAYDATFGDPEATKQSEFGLPPGEFRLLHEMGHLMEKAELRDAYLQYIRSAGSGKAAAAEKIKEVEGKSLKDFGKLEDKKNPVYTADPASEEQFAESFAIYKANPEFLRTKNSNLYAWFKKNGHLSRIR